MVEKCAKNFINICDILFNTLSIIIFLPIFIICFLYRIIHSIFNFKFNFEVGLEVIYNLSLCIYTITVISIIIGALV